MEQTGAQGPVWSWQDTTFLSFSARNSRSLPCYYQFSHKTQRLSLSYFWWSLLDPHVLPLCFLFPFLVLFSAAVPSTIFISVLKHFSKSSSLFPPTPAEDSSADTSSLAAPLDAAVSPPSALCPVSQMEWVPSVPDHSNDLLPRCYPERNPSCWALHQPALLSLVVASNIP